MPHLKTKKLLTIICLFTTLCIHTDAKKYELSTLSAESRAKLAQFEIQMKQISDSMIDGSLPSVRANSLKQFVPILKKACSISGSFSYSFDSLKFLKQLTPPDNSFRLFNWLLKFDDGTYHYFAALQHNHPDSLKLIPFFDKSQDLDSNFSNLEMNPKSWYGALYSQIIQSKIKKKNYYLLVGWNGYDMFSDKKVIEVLHFDSKKGIQLGAPIFKINDSVQKRMVFWYNQKGNMLLNYLPDLKVFTFDNLGPEKPEMQGREWTYVPMGDYNYLQFKKGKWVLKEDLFSEVKKEIKPAGE